MNNFQHTNRVTHSACTGPGLRCGQSWSSAFRRPAGQELSPTSGFTLLEVLLAISLTGAVLAVAATTLVSVTNIWSSRQEVNFFEDHVDGVAEFVQSCLTRAGTEVALPNADSNSGNVPANGANGANGANENPDNSPNISISVNVNTGEDGRAQQPSESSQSGSLLRRSDEPVGWAKPPGFAGYEDPMINFKLKDSPPLFVNTDNAPVIGIDTFLYFKKPEGLSLLWYSILQEEIEDESDLRRTAISPYVKAVNYIYWDERFERWEVEDEPQEGENDAFILPRFIKLIFEHDGVTKERTITIPVPSRSALLF